MSEMFSFNSLIAGNSEDEKINERYSYLFAAKQNKSILKGVVRAQELHRLGASQVRCWVVDLNYGIRGLIPQTQTTIKKARDFVKYVGMEVQFMILEIDRANNIAVASQTEAFTKLKEWALKNIVVGTKLNAEVTNVIAGSLTVNFIGFEFTFYREQLHLLQNDLMQIYTVGDVIPIEVTEVDRKTETLNATPAVEDKFSLIGIRYKLNDLYVAKIKNRISTGYICELEHGLIVFCPFPKNRRNEMLSPGEEVKIQLTKYESGAKKLFGLIRSRVKIRS